jgi:hypothetical protein
MSEEVPETADGAIRGWIVAVGFTLVLIGGELMAEKDGVRFWTGFGLAVAGLPCYLSAAWWKTLKPKLDDRFLTTLNNVATDARWWVGCLFIVLAGLILSPAIEKWIWSVPPLSGFSRPGLLIASCVALLAVGSAAYFVGSFRRAATNPSAIATTRVAKEVRLAPIHLSERNRERRKQEIDELVQSIVTGNTLQSVNHARRFAWLLHSAIYTGDSMAALGNAIIETLNSLVEADNERLTIARRYPENPDISDLIECKGWPEGGGTNPRDTDLLRGLHSYVQDYRKGGNVPETALSNVPTWTFFRDTVKVAEAKAWLQRYAEWCDEVEAALAEMRRALEPA